MSEPKRYTDLQVWEALHLAGSTNGWIRWDDYVRIKANTDEVTLDLKNTNVLLKVDYARLKAEVERLRKAGDDMASSIQFNEEMAKDYNGPTIVHQCVQRWNAAKEGKQP